MTEGEFPALSGAVGDIWDRNADFWDDRMREGNAFHQQLIAPAQERLLNLRTGETVLDVACGNGQFARRIAELGARVVAIDVSARMVEHAASRTVEHRDRIDYRVVDATDAASLAILGEAQFHAAVCTMAMMDMASIHPLLAALSRLLLPGGRFVFSVTHPCFNASGVKLVAEEVTSDVGALVTRYSVNVTEYIRPRAAKGVAMKGQPTAHYYFDRPLSVLFSACFTAGFVVDGLEEPTFRGAADDGRPNWSNITEIPPALVVRLRLAGTHRLTSDLL